MQVYKKIVHKIALALRAVMFIVELTHDNSGHYTCYDTTMQL